MKFSVKVIPPCNPDLSVTEGSWHEDADKYLKGLLEEFTVEDSVPPSVEEWCNLGKRSSKVVPELVDHIIW